MHRSVLTKLAVMTLSLSSAAALADATTQPIETPAQRDARMAWWREARFGMFIHWGVYSVPAGQYEGKPIKGIGEWIMLNAKIPVATYAEYPKQFDAAKFNADEWVTLAKNAGMIYIVISSKHPDGFAMFHTAVDGYNIFDATPFHRDPLAELATACQKQGIKLGFYYSQDQDWHHPGGAAARNGHWDKAQDGDFAAYVKNVALPQVKELLTKYGPVAVLWFDTPTKDMTPELAKQFVDVLHEYQPQIIWNNRLGGGYKGDTETPEQFIPPTGFPGRDWESCMTMNNTWGYKSDDRNYKSTTDLIKHLCDAASKGGNYLLNVGPTSHGEIPDPQQQRLVEVGQWLKRNGEAIYGSAASPFSRPLPFGYATNKPGRVYLSVFNRPADGVLWLPTTSAIRRAALLGQSEPLTIGHRDGGVTIELPKAASDAIADVVVVEFDGTLQTFSPPVEPAAKGKYELGAAYADFGGNAHIAMGRPTDRKGVSVLLSAPADQAKWAIKAANAGTYRATADFVTETGEAGQVMLTAGTETLTGELKPVPSGHAYVDLGTVKLAAGITELSCAATPAAGVKGLRLFAVALEPIATP
ncbi:MAG: hypothetical protein JWM57_2608 [Phycisphaerales bacterium]|nr:hypothetical protein [Phycisphaerales bacterium]